MKNYTTLLGRCAMIFFSSLIIFVYNNGLAGFTQGLDIGGGVSLRYQIDFSEYERLYTDPQELLDIQRTLLTNIEQSIGERVTGLGVNDAFVRTESVQGDFYVVVELGGINDLEAAKATIGETLELQFLQPYDLAPQSNIRAQRLADVEGWIAEPSTLPRETNERISYFVTDHVVRFAIADLLPDDETPTSDDSDDTSTNEGEDDSNDSATIDDQEEDTAATRPLPISLDQLELPGLYPYIFPEQSFFDPVTGEQLSGRTVVYIEEINDDGTIQGSIHNYSYEPQWIIIRDDTTILNGAHFQFAQGNLDPNQPGAGYAVTLSLTQTGQRLLCDASERLVGRPMAIAVGDRIVSRATVQTQLCGGATNITGQPTPQAQQALVDNLNNGAFPAPLILAQEEVISPSLGQQALLGAIISGGIAIVGVAIYLIIQYGLIFGIIGSMILLVYLFVIVSITKLIGYAYSLSGLAAIVLSIGMVVDAMIIIFSRIEEEQNKGATYTQACIDGYTYSLSAIRDGNMTTGLIGLILFLIGENFFRGFGSMLLITIITTLTVVVPMTKGMLHDIQQLIPQQQKPTLS